MIYFDQETRQFSLTDGLKKAGSAIGHAARTSTEKQWEVAGAAGRVAVGLAQRKQLQRKYEEQGMDPDKAKKKAKKESGSVVKNALKGAAGGWAARKAGRIMGLNATSEDKLKMAQRESKSLDSKLKAARVDAKNMERANKIKAANRLKEQQLKGVKNPGSGLGYVGN